MTDLNGVRGGLGGLLALVALLASALAPPPASAAEFGIVPGSFEVRMLDGEGNPQYLAGSHPDRLQIEFALDVEETGTTARDFVFELPPGFGSSPGAVPQCSRELFDKGEEECPPESQVGVLGFGPPESELELPIFQVEPRAGEIFVFGSKPGVDIPFRMEVRPGDFGITFQAADLPEAPVSEGRVELWGVPADRQQGTAIPRRPFLTTPTRCEPLLFTFRTRSWLAGAPWLSASTETAPLGGCEALPFDPQLGFQLSNPVADSPTGARVDLDLPQEDDPDGRATAQLQNLTVDLPDGVTVSPGGAATLGVCSDGQLGLGSLDPASCPPSSRIGTVEFASDLLPDPLTGVIYLGEERAGERFRLFVVVPGPGLVIKFVGAMHADPATGRLSVSMSNLPQVPLARLTLTIDGGPGALLASPLECGPSAATARFGPYGGGAPVVSTVSQAIMGNPVGVRCPGAGPFAPTLEVTGSSPRAGRATGLSMLVHRRDGEQLPRRFAVTLAPGLIATIGSVELCPEPAATSGACPPGSKIGETVAKLGSGASLAVMRGDAYLTGPYRREPFGLTLVFRAAIGPFDLGRIAVRAALRLNRGNARVTVATDQLPAIVEGVLVRFRSIGLEMDRPGFILNPTSCRNAGIDAAIEAMDGRSATAKSPFAVSGCRRLGFQPRISTRLIGRSQLHRHGHPGLRVSARFRRGDTNLRAMNLVLPQILKFDLAAVEAICARPDAIEGECTGRSRVGGAQARSPILSRPLKGSMYLVRPEDDGLPDLWLSMTAMGVHMDLKAQAVMERGRLAIQLAGLPDVPLSAFAMSMPAGKEGVFSLGAELCRDGRARRLASQVAVKGQNGRHRNLRIPTEARPGCGNR